MIKLEKLLKNNSKNISFQGPNKYFPYFPIWCFIAFCVFWVLFKTFTFMGKKLTNKQLNIHNNNNNNNNNNNKKNDFCQYHLQLQ